MTECHVKRFGPALQGATDQDADYIRTLPTNETFKVNITRPRNSQFHRKYFALLNWAYDEFEPDPDPDFEAKWGMVPEKNFDRFRKDIAILAGYGEAHINIKGEVRMEAKSISFAKMTEDEFLDLYNKTLNVLWTRIFVHKYESEEELRDVAAQLEDFG